MKSLPMMEIFRTANQALLRNWARAVLTSLSMVIGTASLVVVIIAGITGRDYTLELIRGVGTNLIGISNESVDSAMRARALADMLSFDDLNAVSRIPGRESYLFGSGNSTADFADRHHSGIQANPQYPNAARGFHRRQ
jgi:hypothetical protein